MKANRFKFRAWDTTTKDWVWGWNRDIAKAVRPTPSWEYYLHIGEDTVAWDCEGGRVIIMQSTGLCDLNGQEVFEGDVVDYDGKRGEVWFNECSAHFFVDPDKGLNIEIYMVKHAFVIGNIYENPELLEAT